MKSTLFSIIGSLLFLLCIAQAQQAPRQQRTHEAMQARHGGEEDAIREAVFRYAITLRSWNAANSRIFYLGIDPGNNDPSRALLRRFADHSPPVQPISRAVRVAPERIKGQIGSKYEVRFRIGPIDWINSTQVQVQASDWAGWKMAMRGTLRVTRRNDRWVVQRTQRPLIMSSFARNGGVVYQNGRHEVFRPTKCALDLPAPLLSRTTRSCSGQPQQNKAPTHLDNGASAMQEAIHGNFVAAGLYAGGKRLMLAARNQILELWDLQTGRRLDGLIGYDDDDIYLTCAAITPDGTRAFLGGLKRVVVWDIAHRRVIEGWGENWGDTCSMAMSADGKTLLLGQAGGYAELRSVSTGARIRVIYQSKNVDAAPDALALSANGRYALVAEWGDVTLCEVATGRKLGRFAREPGFGRSSTKVAFSPDSNSFATIGFGAWPANSPSISSLRLWDRRTGKLIWKLVPPADETIFDIEFTPDGKHLVTGGDLIRMWDVATHREIRHFPEQNAGSVYSRLLITPDGQEVFSQHLDNHGERAVELWKLATGERVPIWVRSPNP